MRAKFPKLIGPVSAVCAMLGVCPTSRADTLYDATPGTQTTLYQYTSPVVDGSHAGIGDDYTTNFSSINVTSMTFYGGLTNTLDHLVVEFYDSNSDLLYSVYPYASESQGIGLHTLSSGDFTFGRIPGITIPGNGYVVFAPISYATALPGGTTTPGDPNPPIFNLGWGQAPTIGANYSPTSAESDANDNITTAVYVAGVKQYAQFSLIGTGTGPLTSDGIWTSTGSGDWQDTAAWQNLTVATGATQTATFGDSIGSGSATVGMTANESIGTITFNGSAGGNYTIAPNSSISPVPALTLDNGSSSAVISVNSGSQTISSPTTFVNGLNITTNLGSKLTLPLAITATGTLYKGGAGTLQFTASAAGITTLSLPGINISAGTLALASNAVHTNRTLLMTSALSINGGSLDLGNNDLDLTGGGSAGLSLLTGYGAAGYHAGSWNGSGGIDSSAAASNTTHLTALGVIINSVNGTSTGAALFGSGTTLGLFDGTSPANTDVLVKYTYYGDTNLDGKVDGSDYSRIDAAYLADQNHPGTATGWFNGDFNYDGVINGSDYTLIDNAFNTQGASLSSEIENPTAVIASQIAGISAPAAVPEPSAIALIAFVANGLLCRRIRRRCFECLDTHLH